MPALEVWEGRTVAAWQRAWGVPHLTVLAATPSTNDIARALAARGATAGSVVIADEQTRGRGRGGRTWTAPPGSGLLLSVVLHVEAGPDGPAEPTAAPIRVGIAAAAAVRAATGLDARVKWPNDLVLDPGGKLGGILCEATSGPGATHIVAGIGINVHQEPPDFPADLAAAAVSVRMAGGRADRAALAGALLQRLRPFRLPSGPLDDALLADWAALDVLAGQEITLDGARVGVAVGIAPDGALRVRGPTGERRILSGTVRPASTGTRAPATP